MIRKKIAIIFCTLIGVLLIQAKTFGQTQTFPAGSAIIDMGSASPTVANSLKPYGLIYSLLKYYNTPVYCVINQTKIKDGIDFVYNNKSYSGGTFILSSDFFTSNVSNQLTSWANQGVVIDYTTSDLTVNVTYKLSFTPKWVLDKTNGNIAKVFLSNAGIPSTAYSFKDPSQLGDCDDIFILPHADPTWATHRNLYFWNQNQRGAIWAGCHAVSVLENTTKDTIIGGVPTTLRMNFLSTAGLLNFTDHTNGITPYSSGFPTDPMGQYIGKTDNAQLTGSETVFLPKIGSAWRSGTRMLSSSPGDTDIPRLSPGPAGINIYGRGFDGANNGYVCYQASHNIASSSTADDIAAQRIFFNFSYFALNDKISSKISASITGLASELKANTASSTLTATVTGDGGPFTYKWSANVAGTFSAATSATTTFTPSNTVTPGTSCILTLVVTDANCSRVSFDVKKTKILAQTPPLASSTAAQILKTIGANCSANNTITFNVFDSNIDPNAGTRTMITLTGLANGTVLSSTNGSITYTPSANFLGTDVGTYTISNTSATAQGAISITVGDATLIPALTDDAVSVLEDNVTVVNVIANDLNTPSSANGNKLYVRDITTKPTKGFVYLNVDGTLSYLSNKDLSGGTGSDSFKYLACNDVGYCAVGTVTVTLVADGCSGGQYKLTTTGTTSTGTFNPSADSYIQSNAGNTNFGAATSLQINGVGSAIRKPVLKFDLSSISATATVNSAILTLTTAVSSSILSSTQTPFPATIYGLSRSWNEGTANGGTNSASINGVTYNVTSFVASGGITWTGAGASGVGDFADLSPNNPTIPTPIVVPASGTVTLNTGVAVGSSDLKTIAQNWVTTPASNNGILISPAVSGTSISVIFNSRTAGSALPTLTVNYITPAPCLTIPTTYKPIAYPDTSRTKSNTAVTIDAKANDLNYYGNPNSITSVTTPANGTASIDGSNKILYTPNGSFVGTDTLTYTITDGTNGQTATATVRIVVTRVAPLVNVDFTSTNSNTAKTINVGANDSDPQAGATLGAPVITSLAKNGTATVVGNNIVYTPSKNFTGKDTLIYQRTIVPSDACTTALSDTAIVFITVNNQAPVATNDAISTFTCTPVTIRIKDNDTDPENDALTVTIVTNPSNGTLTANADGTYTYSPNTNFSGVDQFTYTVKDPGLLTSNVATATITVTAGANPNTAPSAVADSDNTLANQPVYTNVLANDSDPNSDPLTLSITASGLKAPSNGTIQLMPNKLIKYTPNANFTGTDTYEYQITDTHPSCAGSSSLSTKALVTIKVTALPILAGGTIWNDVDYSGTETFTNIKTGAEVGTNVNGSIYVYLTDSTNTILDFTPADDAGVYQLSNVPSNTPKLNLILSTQSLPIGGTLSSPSLPTGYTNTSPSARVFATGSTDITGYDFGVVATTVTGGTIALTAVSFCGTGTPGSIASTVAATGFVSMIWQSSTTSGGSGFTDIAGATGATYTPSSAITATTWYRRKALGAGLAYAYSNAVIATVNPQPTVTITPSGATTFCAGGTVTLTASANSSYLWSTGATTQAISVAASGTYSVTVSNSNNTCSATSTTTSVTVNPLPTATITAGGPTTFCIGGSVTLTSGSATGNVWSTGATTQSININTSGTYTVTVTNGNGCSATSAGTTVTVNALPVVTVSPTSVIVAVGASTTLSASGAATYSWTPATNLSATTGASVVATTAVAGSIIYTVTGTDGNGCSSSAGTTVTASSLPVASAITGPCAVIKDSTRTFTVSAINATRYVWTLPSGWIGSSTTNSISVKVNNTGGTITVTPFNGNIQGNTVSFTANVIDYAKVTIGGLPVTASGNRNSSITVTVTLFDVNGNRINCSGGPATIQLCDPNPGSFTAVIDNNDGTYTTSLTASANTLDLCGTVGGIPILKKATVTFTGPQGGIKASVPQLATETPKLTFTMTAGRAPFTIIYKSAKSNKTDTLTNYTSATPTGVALIPSTTLYTLVSIIDANGERRDNNFTRDTASVIVLAPRVIITLKADQAKPDVDSTWITVLRVRTKNIGDMDLTNSQAKLDLRTVFPAPVTFKLDSVRYSGTTITPNTAYDGINANDLFARLNNRSKTKQVTDMVTEADNAVNSNSVSEPINTVDGAADGTIRVFTNKNGTGSIESTDETVAVQDEHSIYMFGPKSSLPIGVEADIILYLHVKPNGYTDPFVMQAVALGTGTTDGATALATSISNDNNDINSHPEITKQGDPIPTVINLFPRAVIGSSLNAGTPVLQGNGSYNVPFTIKLNNYGNLNLQSVQLGLNLLRSIGAPSTFSIVGAPVSTGDLLLNPSYNGKTDTNMLAANSILGYNKGFSTITFTVNIVTNQLSSIYRLQATAYGFSDQLLTTVNDLSTDGLDPDPDGNNIPSEKIKTVITINLPIPPLVPAPIAIKTGPTTTALSVAYCVSTTGVVVIPTALNTGGSDPYEYQWQSSTNNTNFTDIVGATDSTYTSGLISSSIYVRRQVISGNQFKFSNSVFIQIYPQPAKPVISGTGTQVVGKGSVVLTSTVASTYKWSTTETARSITALAAGNYLVTITDANGCTNVSDAFTITALDPYKVADLQKVLSKAPVLQSDGTYILGFTFLSSNLRSELLDSVRIKDDLSKVFPATVDYQVTQIQASGKLKANTLFNGNSQTDLLSDVSQLGGLTKDSVQVTLRVSPNGFSGKLLNQAVLTANSPFGQFSVTSNDPTVGNGVGVRNPTPFTLPLIDIFIPSGFSPNHDGVNDNFVIIRPFGTTINLEIFNRWGNAVYKAPDYKNEWDGRGNQPNNILGEMLPDGTYYYIATATDKFTGNIRKFAGFVTLKR